jgi:hypothetical protein
LGKEELLGKLAIIPIKNGKEKTREKIIAARKRRACQKKNKKTVRNIVENHNRKIYQVQN